METMRDAFFNALFPLAKNDPSIMLLAADFSAPSFDRWREELPGQFVNSGISEQNSILTASGLALSGQKVFVVGIAPFITMRPFEQIRLFAADMNLNVCIVGVGAGFSYLEAGATHHAVEDLALMSLVPNMRILSPSGNSQVRSFPERILARGGPHYLRLDRYALPDQHAGANDFSRALIAFGPDDSPLALIATGATLECALGIKRKLAEEGISIMLADAFQLPLDLEYFREIFAQSELIVTMEEHVAQGGLGWAVRRALDQSGVSAKLVSFALDLSRGLAHSYGPRELLWSRYGLDREKIIKTLRLAAGRTA